VAATSLPAEPDFAPVADVRNGKVLVGTDGEGRVSRRLAWLSLWLLVAAVPPVVEAPEAVGVNAAHSVIVSANPVNWTPQVLGSGDEQVEAIAQIGDRVYVGGKFDREQETPTGRIFRRDWLFAYDADTGRIDRAFHPRIDARVYAIAVAPSRKAIFIGGEFHTIDGVAKDFVAKLDAATGEPFTSWGVRIFDSVRDVVVRGDTVYIAGEFEKVDGLQRVGLAALDPATGAVKPGVAVPFEQQRGGPQPVVKKIDVSPDGSRLVAVGNFTRVGGRDRTELAVLDLTTSPATVADWETDRWKAPCIPSEDSYLEDVDISPDGSYFVTVSIGYFYPGTLCDTAARWELHASGEGIQPTWVDYTGGDSLLSVAVTGAAVYVGGHQRWMNNPFSTGVPGPGAVPRSGIAALDPLNGLPYSWNPGRSRGNGVFVQFGSRAGLYLGSDTDELAGEYHSKFGFFPVAGGEPVPEAAPGSIPGDLYRLGYDDGALVRRHFDGSEFDGPSQAAPGVDWSGARGAFMLSGTLYTGWEDGHVYARSFDGVNVGPAVDLHATAFGSPDSSVNPSRITSMFFAGGRLYYTARHDRHLHYRYFTAESGVVGAQEFTLSGRAGDLSWRRVRGMTLADRRLYFAIDEPGTDHDGNLYRMKWRRSHPVGRTKELVSGPDTGDGLSWKSRGLFVFSG
jgi:hypothetical protein